MTTAESVHRVRIYLSERDQWQGGALYLAVMEALRREGATGATALRGLAGFGPGFWTRAGSPLGVGSNQPVVIEWVDRSERIGKILPMIDPMVPNALITVEPVRVYRAVLRQRGPFSTDAMIADLTRATPHVATGDMPLRQAIELMAAQKLDALPVLSNDRKWLGLISKRELAWRLQLRIPLGLLAILSTTERDEILAPAEAKTASQIVSDEPRPLAINTPVPRALVALIESGYDHLGVVERDGGFVGFFEATSALKLFAQSQVATETGSNVRDAEPPTPVRLVMQTMLPQVSTLARLVSALNQLITNPSARIAVVDEANHLIGMITAESALRSLSGAERSEFLSAMQRGPTPNRPLAIGDYAVTTAMVADPPMIKPTDSVVDATKRLLELQLDSLFVVEDDNRLAGILARGGIVRSLVQQSE